MNLSLRVAIAALLFSPAWGWSPLPARTSRLPPSMAKKGAAKPKKAAVAKGGFGGGASIAPPKPSGVGTGIKALKKQYGVFLELQKEGAKTFDVVVRSAEKKGDWVKVGSVCSQGDDAHAAVQVQLALILEHALVVRPGFAIVKSSLEAGWRAEPETEEGEASEEPAAVSDAEVTPLERKAIPQGSVKAGYRNLIPIAAPTMKAAM